MNFKSTLTTYEQTGFFSKFVLDYLKGGEQLKPFYKYPVSIDGIRAAIADRKKYPGNRALLVAELQKQYRGITLSAKQQFNLAQLNQPDTYTITTAHQPNLFTGHLYFIYKILHAIKLCDKLIAEIPEHHFVPVFYMGSEDADLEELGHVTINGIKHEWQTEQTGAFGRMVIDKALIKILDTLAGELTIHPFGAEIVDQMKACYTDGLTIEQATFKLINNLFGEYGLIVFLPDNPALKGAFIPIVEKELKEQFSYKMVADTVADFPAKYKVQAGGRALNLFYLNGNRRDRIEKHENRYTIMDTGINLSPAEILLELKTNPERFSPNVILRPVFQEMILPNIVFIGGGGEVAYWLELKKVFDAVQVPFPVIVLRNSILVVEKKVSEKWRALGFSNTDLFKPEQDLMKLLVKRDSAVQLNLEKEKQGIHTFYTQIKSTAGAVDTTLQKHVAALEKQALTRIEALEKKMLRAEKRKFEAQQRQLNKLKTQLFPHQSLQERVENLMPFYAKWGNGFIKHIYENSLGLEQDFVILEEAE